MKEISLISKKRLEYSLEDIEGRLDKLKANLEEAKAHGDLSENSEYEASLAEYTKTMQEKTKIEYTLATSTVKQTYSPNIANGSLISVKLLGSEDGKEPEDMGILLFDDGGSALFSGVVSKESPLGRAIYGGITGEYIVKDIRGVDLRYHVVLEPDSKTDEYLTKYPPNRNKTLDKIFEGL